MKTDSNMVVVGEIQSAHGIKGLVKLRHFCDTDDDFKKLTPLSLSSGAQVEVKVSGVSGQSLLVSIKGVESRDAAEKLKGQKLYVSREKFPETKTGEFYQHDLIGSTCCLPEGTEFGRVIAIHNFGASDVLEIKIEATGEAEMFAFTEETFPEIDLENKRLIINPPEEI